MQYTLPIRVRYQETDAQGHVHHAAYLTYFEAARVEMLRDRNISYKALEEDGILLVVHEAECRYHVPAQFDDLLQVKVFVVQAKGARMHLKYEVVRDSELVTEGRTLLACINRQGRPTRLPKHLLLD